jgi:hypothetical protein
MMMEAHVCMSERFRKIYTCGRVGGKSATEHECTEKIRTGQYWCLNAANWVQLFEEGVGHDSFVDERQQTDNSIFWIGYTRSMCPDEFVKKSPKM